VTTKTAATMLACSGKVRHDKYSILDTENVEYKTYKRSPFTPFIGHLNRMYLLQLHVNPFAKLQVGSEGVFEGDGGVVDEEFSVGGDGVENSDGREGRRCLRRGLHKGGDVGLQSGC
jgi:hypothetical protein